MFGLHREFRPYLAGLILKTVLYGSWVLGLFPFIFDSRRRQLRRSRWLILYGLIITYSLLFLMAFLGFEFLKLRKVEAFDRNPVLERIDRLVGVISIFSGLVINFMNFRGSKKVDEIVNEMLSLDLFLVILICLLHVSLVFNTMHYYIGILLIYRYVWIVNGQLQELVNQQILNPTTDMSRIREIHALYNRLLDLNKKLVSTYEYHMILILTSWLAGNVVVIYFFIVYRVSMRKLSIFLIVFPQSLLINIWGFWLTIAVCELTEKAGRKTSALLKRFTDLERRDDQLERSVNEFAWLCSHRKFQFQLCGLFSVNYKMGFQMIITSFLYLLYLVQFDYMNL